MLVGIISAFTYFYVYPRAKDYYLAKKAEWDGMRLANVFSSQTLERHNTGEVEMVDTEEGSVNSVAVDLEDPFDPSIFESSKTKVLVLACLILRLA